MSVGLTTPGGGDLVAQLVSDGYKPWMSPVEGGWEVLVEGVPAIRVVTAAGPFPADSSTAVGDWVATRAHDGSEIYRGSSYVELVDAMTGAWATEATFGPIHATEWRLIAVNPGPRTDTCPCGAPLDRWYQTLPDGDSESRGDCTNATCRRSTF